MMLIVLFFTLRMEAAPGPQIIRNSEVESGSAVAESLLQHQESWSHTYFLIEMTMMLIGS